MYLLRWKDKKGAFLNSNIPVWLRVCSLTATLLFVSLCASDGGRVDDVDTVEILDTVDDFVAGGYMSKISYYLLIVRDSFDN